jgi:hypothetical protein
MFNVCQGEQFRDDRGGVFLPNPAFTGKISPDWEI